MARPDQIVRINRDIEERFGLAAAVRANGTLYLSGLLSVTDDFRLVGAGDMGAQIARIYERMQRVLAAAGCSLKDVVAEISFTTDMDALAAAAHVRDGIYRAAGAAPPAATAVEVRRLYLPGALLELQATAILPASAASASGGGNPGDAAS